MEKLSNYISKALDCLTFLKPLRIVENNLFVDPLSETIARTIETELAQCFASLALPALSGRSLRAGQ